MPASANTWEKVVFVPTSTDYVSTTFASILTRTNGTGDDLFVDDIAIYSASAEDTTAPNAPTSPTVTAGSGQLTVGWTAASGGIDNGGYMVVRGTTDPTTTPNVNGIYAVNNTVAAGQTVVYVGTATSFIDTGLSNGTTYRYRIYTFDKAYNYSTALTTSGTPAAAVVAPTVTTPTATAIATTSATLGANVTADGGAALSSRGTVWGTSANPTGNALAEGSTTTGVFAHSRTGLTANTSYFYRGYAVNSAGTGYSADGTFTTLPLPPTVGTGSSATTSGFTANWSHPTMGSAAYTYTVEVDDDINFGSINATQSSIASGNTSQAITGLAAGTTYYFRVRSVNGQGSSANSSTSAGIATTAASGTLGTSTSSLSALTATPYGTASAPANFTVTGSGLDSSGVTVTPPAGFEVSGTSNFASVGTSASPLSLGTSATLNTTVYVRLAATTVPGSYSGNISVAGGGASTQTVSIASSTVNTKELTISSPQVTAKTYDGTTAATITGTLSGIEGSDSVSLTGTGTFDSADAGSGKSVTSTSTLGGADAARYTLTQPTGLTGTINKASQMITFGALNPAVVGGSSINLSATVNSSLTVSYSSSDTAVATVAGNTVTIVGAGSTTITASQAGDTNYNAAPNVTQTLRVVANATTTLAAGDLAVIGYQTSGSPDYFYVLVLKDLGPGTIFYVNDNEIAADGGTSFTDLGEGEASFTVKAGQAIAAGTVLNLPWGAAAVSTTQYDWSSTSGFGMGAGNEEIYIYTAAAITDSTPTAFIFGADIGSSTSARPSGLTAGSTFISPTGNASRYKLTTATYSGTAAQLLAAIGDTATNWEGTAPAATTDWTFSVTPPPTISTSGTLSAVPTTYGTASSSTQFSVSGANMTAGILVTPPSGFEVSTDNSTFSATVTVGSSGTISSTTVYVRLAATASAGSKSGNIQLTSSGAAPVNVATVASTVSTGSLAAGDITLTAVGDGSYTASGPAGSTFTIGYSGRTANGIATSYSSATAPTAAGYYTVTATATGNYSGSNTADYFVAGPVAVSDAITKPAGNPSLVLTLASLLANDVRITSAGAVATDGLSITGVTNGSGNSAQIDGGDILFTPSSASPETFTYTLSYGIQTAIGTVTVTTESSAPTFTLQIAKVGTAAFAGGNTTVTHDFIGVPTQTYLVEYTTNLDNGPWTSAGNQSTGATGSFSVTFTKSGDVAADWNAHMFFRARLLP